ncbi:MAG: hypothetical protein K9J85_00585 [Desulfobacteraceae bacterium]|nr:hypothetical protein [Desulfobacteraceae bacterium]
MFDPEKDNLQIRCPRLGSIIPFRYCLISGEDSMPCFKIMDCWWEIFDVDSYLKENLPQDIYQGLASAKPKPKVASIVEIAEEAMKKRDK